VINFCQDLLVASPARRAARLFAKQSRRPLRC
jgi:hypothetical protein